MRGLFGLSVGGVRNNRGDLGADFAQAEEGNAKIGFHHFWIVYGAIGC
jgi:hypothetical protein